MTRWPIKPFLSLCDFQGGTQPPKDTFVYKQTDGYVRLVQIRDYESDDDLTFVPATPKLKTCSESDVMIARYGASLGRILRGKAGAYNVALVKTIPDESQLTKNFLFHWLNSPFFQTYLAKVAVRAAQAGFNKEDFGQLKMPVPPLREQERIVKLLDDADELRKLRAQADRRTAQLIPALFHEMFGDVTKNPNNWPVKLFTDVCDSRLGKMLDARKQTGKHSRPYMRNLNVQWGYLNLDKVFEMDFNERERQEFRLQFGDVLICEGGAGVGQTAIWRDELPECYFQKSLHRVRPLAGWADSEYIAHLMWELMKTNGVLHAVSSATIPHLTGEKLRRLRIPVPPLSLQKEFAARVGEIRAMQSEQAQIRRRLDDLFQSMLHRAFNGEL